MDKRDKNIKVLKRVNLLKVKILDKIKTLKLNYLGHIEHNQSIEMEKWREEEEDSKKVVRGRT